MLNQKVLYIKNEQIYIFKIQTFKNKYYIKIFIIHKVKSIKKIKERRKNPKQVKIIIERKEAEKQGLFDV